MSAEEGPWLVKSGGRIAGPYSTAQIEQMIATREFSVMDEIAQPVRRWLCVRDVPIFAAIVEDIRIQNIKFGEDTFGSTGEATNTITLTEPGSSQNLDDRTDDLSRFNKSTAEIVYDDIEDVSDHGSERTNSFQQEEGSKNQSYKSYGFQDDPALAKQAQATTRLAWLVTGAILFGISTFVVYNRFIAMPFHKRGSASDIRKSAMESLSIGDYRQALEGFKKSFHLDPLDEDNYVYLGTLQIQVAKQTVEGRRVLQDVVENGKGVFPKLAISAMGIADLMDDNPQAAEEKFSRALAIDSYYAPAKINLGATALLKGDAQTARDWLSGVVDQGVEDGAAHLMLAEADIDLFRKSGDRSFLDHAQKQLTRLMQLSYDYFQEAALMLAYLDFVSGNKGLAEQKLPLIVDVDPLLTEDHRHDLFVYRGRVSWKSLSSKCLQMLEGLTPSSLSQALKGYCQFRGGQEVEALKSVTDASSQATADPLVQSIYAFILDGIGQETRAAVALGKAVELNSRNQYSLPIIMQGRFYARAGKPELALSQWQKLYHINEKSLIGLAGLARAHFDLKNFSDAQSYLIEGFRLSRDYRPLHQLKQEAEKEGLMPKGSL